MPAEPESAHSEGSWAAKQRGLGSSPGVHKTSEVFCSGGHCQSTAEVPLSKVLNPQNANVGCTLLSPISYWDRLQDPPHEAEKGKRTSLSFYVKTTFTFYLSSIIKVV